jgi:type VI secretion system protein ImpH
MESGTRQTTSDLTGQLLQEARHHQFYQLVERIHRLNQDNLEQPLDIQPRHELIRYETDAALAFPKSDVCQAGVEQRDSQEQYFIQVSFMGMHGSASPLPHHYLEQIAYEHHQNIGVRAPFFNFFNHRLVTLLHRAWRKYRYYIRFSPKAEDRFSQNIFSLIGLNDSDLRGDTPIPWSRLLTYVGMVATRSRAPSMVAGIVAHCFDLEQVEVKEWEQRYVEIPKVQTNRLGGCNIRLSEDFVIGDKVLNIGSKFVVSIRNLNQQRFREFLPEGEWFAPLNSLVEFLLRDQLAYDLELGLIQEEVPPFRLHKQEGANLGWTAFLGKAELMREAVIRIGVRR